MSNANKKRSGIGGFWDTLAPEQPEVPANEVQPTTGQEPTQQRKTPARPQQQTIPPPQTAPPAPLAPEPATSQRGRGRPRNEEPKARTTVNMSPHSWRLLEALRYRARMQGRRNTTYADLLDEAIALLAKQRNVTLEDE